MSAAAIALTLPTATVLCPAALGQTRTFVAEGRVNQIIDPLGTLNFTYLGAPFRYQFSFDLAAPDLNGTPTYAVYDGLSSLTTIANTSFLSLSAPRIEIQHPSDFFNVGSGFAYPGSQRSGAGLRLGLGTTDNSLTNVLLPSEPYEPSPFPYTSLVATFEYPDPGSSSPYLAGLVASVDRFYAIPEPSTLVSVAIAVTLLRRRHH